MFLIYLTIYPYDILLLVGIHICEMYIIYVIISVLTVFFFFIFFEFIKKKVIHMFGKNKGHL